MLCTVGTDQKCKIWDITNVEDGQPKPLCVKSRDMKQGDLFCVQMYKDIPWVLAAGGSNGELAIWDTEEDVKVKAHFKEGVTQKAKDLKKVADKGLEADEEDKAGGDSSGWEDYDSE